MYKSVIIDDEQNAREALEQILTNFCEDIAIVGKAENIKTGKDLILKTKPDIVFLDIEMPDGTGFDLLEQLPEHNFSLIFATGHNDFALQAFQYNALDYILKPVDIDDVINAVEKAKKTKPQINEELVKQLLLSVNEKQHKKLILKTSEEIHIITVDDIIRCEAEGGYTTFYLTDRNKILISKNLKEYESILKNNGFIRTHNSHLVNMNYIEKYKKSDGGFLIMKDKTQIPVSLRKKEAVLDALENFF